MRAISRFSILFVSAGLLAGCAPTTTEDFAPKLRAELKATCIALSESAEYIQKPEDVIRVADELSSQLQDWWWRAPVPEDDFEDKYVREQSHYNNLADGLDSVSWAEDYPTTKIFDYLSILRTCGNYEVNVGEFTERSANVLPTGLIDLDKELRFYLKNPELAIELILNERCSPTSPAAFSYELKEMGGSFAGQFMVIHRGVVIEGIQVTDTIINSYIPGTLSEPFYYGVGPNGVNQDPWNCPESANFMTVEELVTARN